MLNWTTPDNTPSRVKQAGKNIRDNIETLDDLAVLENWRAAHAYIINTFQANIRKRVGIKNYIVGQRLKRKPTIIDKLRREPNMQLSTMHDIAGCRVIFPDVDSLNNFRKSMHTTSAKHELIAGDKFNYIEKPKNTGYRGIHDVYKYNAGSKSGKIYNNLRIEIQYRTSAQHAWATAVETADLLNRNRAKFNEGEADYQEYWRITSEIIARTKESLNSSFPHLPNLDLKNKYVELEHKFNIVRLLENAKLAANIIPATYKYLKSKNTILIYYFDANVGTEVISYNNTKAAIDAYNKNETELRDLADVVLVKSEDLDNLKRVFQNYFNNADDYIRLLQDGLKIL